MDQGPLLILLLVSSLLAGCTARSRTLSPDTRATAPVNSTGRQPIAVQVFDVQASPSTNDADLLIPAALSVEDTAVVLAEREGRILTQRGPEGARVTKGDLLAQFNDDDQRSQLRQAEIEVKRLQVEEQQYQALVKLNRSQLERESSLFHQGVSSTADVERAQYTLDQSTHEYEKTRLATDSARARVEAVNLELEKSTIRAPIAGVITHRYIALGTNVARNDKLFEVSRLAPLELKFQLPQGEKSRLSRGQIVNLSPVNDDSRVIAKARIRRIDPVANATTDTLGYLADVVGGAGLMPGLAVNVHLPRAAGDLTFWVPRAAFPAAADLRGGGQSSLFVVDGDRCAQRFVKVNKIEGDQIEIMAGLAIGDRVILSPPGGLKEGDQVQAR